MTIRNSGSIQRDTSEIPLISPNQNITIRNGVSIKRDAKANFSVTGNDAAYPRATILANGQILGIYTAFKNNQQTMTLVSSINNGKSWTLRGTAATKPVKNGTLDNGFVNQLSSGRVLAAYRNHDIDASGNFRTYRISMSSSDDNGASWKFLSDPVVVAAKPVLNGVWEPFMRNAADGSLQLYYSQERSDADQDSIMISSKDGGKTWSKETSVSGLKEPNSRDGMVGIAELGGSKLLAIFETKVGNGTFHLSSVSSIDDGKTWCNRSIIYLPPKGKNAGAPQITRVGKSLVASFMTEEDNELGNATSWIDVADAKFIISSDGGKIWNKTTVFQEPSRWPGLLTLKDQKSFLYLVGFKGLESQRFVL